MKDFFRETFDREFLKNLTQTGTAVAVFAVALFGTVALIGKVAGDGNAE